ncbi:hypothetical protein THII_1891 [Thioploca ingrica]|uniref:Signaling pathway modulator ZraP n=1 Tax=Thioploca ingrica TaxID=40754 RepID=A0A090AE07_9GAMM|nr:hypothetical protein THII_1891 [Thioploca ingrica]
MNQSQLRLIGILLLSSLALNLFFGGWLVGHFLNPLVQQGGAHQGPMMMKFHWLIQSLPAASQKKVLPLLQEHQQRIQPQFQKVQQARQVVYQQLIAPDFNAAALSSALANLHQQMSQMQQMMQADLVKIASQLSAEERRQLVTVAQSPRPHHRVFSNVESK